MVGSGRVNFVTKESVNVYTEVYAYDEFSLVVDLGKNIANSITDGWIFI